MNLLLLGSGGREHALAWKIAQSPKIEQLFIAPGSAGTAQVGTNVALRADDFEGIERFVLEHHINMVVVGPEDPLVKGIYDYFAARPALAHVPVIGPSKAGAVLEGSKDFAKAFMQRHNIPTAAYRTFDGTQVEEGCAFLATLAAPYVLKADGLCAGKGVIIAQSRDEAKATARDMLSGESFGEAGKRVVVEEFLDGFELSFFAICDGENFVSLPVAQDHKRLKDNDEGPNTGGMGAYAPSPLASQELIKQVEEEVVKPTLKGMKAEGNPFCGVLFVGLMVVKGVPYVLEFNVRFGDPECEVLMPLIDGDLGEILLNAAKGDLKPVKLKDEFAVGVVMASKNYPFSSSPKAKISVKNVPENSHIAYAGVSEQGGEIYADGGRVLVCVGLGKSIKQAQQKAYELCENVEFDGVQYRKDIAWQMLKGRE